MVGRTRKLVVATISEGWIWSNHVGGLAQPSHIVRKDSYDDNGKLVGATISLVVGTILIDSMTN